MQDFTDKLKDLTSRAGEGLSRGLEYAKEKAPEIGKGITDAAGKAKDYLGANPTVAAMLLAGGGAGLLGGYLTSRQREEEGESKASRRMRILRNALLAAGAGAGAVGLGAQGFKTLAEAVPVGSKNPVEEKLTSPFMRALGAGGAGAYAFNRADKAQLANKAEAAFRALPPKLQTALSGKASPEQIIAVAESAPHNFKYTAPTSALGSQIDKLQDLQRIQGALPGRAAQHAPKIQKLLQVLLGTSGPGRIARLAGAGGLMFPELLGGAKDLLLAGD